jgi:colicin import membrane protein
MNVHHKPDTGIAVIVATTPAIVFADPKKADELFVHIEREIAEFKPDLSTETSRKRIASLAYKVAQTKTAIDAAGAELNEEANRTINAVNAERRKFKIRLDELRDLARKPLTDWEEAESLRKQAMDAILNRIGFATVIIAADTADIIAARLAQVTAEEIDPSVFQDKFDEAVGLKDGAVSSLSRSLERAKQAEADRLELERLRAEQAQRDREEAAARAEERRKAEAAEQSRVEQERAARAAKEDQARIAKAAEDARLKAEREAEAARQKVEREHQVALDKAEAEKQAVIDAAARAERHREAEAKQAAADQAKRDADKKHKAKIMGAAKDALMKHAGIDEEPAKKIVLAILANQIPNISLRF